jgi:hypothetical protein
MWRNMMSEEKIGTWTRLLGSLVAGGSFGIWMNNGIAGLFMWAILLIVDSWVIAAIRVYAEKPSVNVNLNGTINGGSRPTVSVEDARNE